MGRAINARLKALRNMADPLSPSHACGKSRMGQHFINRRFQPTVPGLTDGQVPQGRHFLRNVPSLRDLIRRLPCRRLKPTVNKISSLRDWTCRTRAWPSRPAPLVPSSRFRLPPTAIDCHRTPRRWSCADDLLPRLAPSSQATPSSMKGKFGAAGHIATLPSPVRSP